MNLEKIASKLLDSIQDFASENPGLTAGVLAGGGLGLMGGAMAPSTSDDPDEDPDERIKRRVRNALVLGSLGAAGAGLMGYGANNMLLPIAEGSGLSLNESMNLQAPLLAAGGAGLTAGLWDRKNKLKAAEQLWKHVKPANGADLAGAEAREALHSILRDSQKGTNLRVDLANALKLGNGKTIEDAADLNKVISNSGKTITSEVDKALERAGISTTADSDRINTSDVKRALTDAKSALTAKGTSMKDRLLQAGKNLDTHIKFKKQLGRLGRAAMRNKATIGAAAGAGLLADYLFGND